MDEPKPQQPAVPKRSRDEEITRLVRACIGPRWETHYAKAWRKLGSGAGVNIGVSWNWAAALLTVPWLAYRKQVATALGVGVLFAIFVVFVGRPVTELTGSPYYIYLTWLVVALVFGLYGDVLVLQRAYAVAAAAHDDAGSSQAVASGVIAAGGVSPGRVVGIFTIPPIALGVFYYLFLIPYLDKPRRNEEVAMRLYLDQLLTMEEQYRVDSGRYMADTAAFKAIADSVDRMFTPIIDATDSSFHATVTATPPLTVRCAVAVGSPNPLSGDSTSSIACR